MDDIQYANNFDIDLMKRSMDSIGGPDAVKKPRWSPSSSSTSARNTFDNYGYGSFPTQPQSQSLYNNASLSLNTALANSHQHQHSQINRPPSAISPASAAFPQQQPQTPNGPFAAAAAAYGMSGMMGMPALGGMGMLSGYGFSPQVSSFQQAFQQQQHQQQVQQAHQAQSQLGRVPSALNLQAASSQVGGGNLYSPAAAAAAAAAAAVNNQTGRTVYVGNLPSDASVDELLNLVHFGPLESVRVLPEKSCVFISFLDGATAAAFHADATVRKLSLHGQELKIGWGKPSPVPSQVMLSITQSNASRNVYLGGLDENMTEENLRDELSRFGLIDQVKIVRDKNIGFVHFLSIATATKVVATLPTEPSWAGKRVNYGKDRCAYIPKSQQAAAAAAQVAAAQSLVAQSAVAAAQVQQAQAVQAAQQAQQVGAGSQNGGGSGQGVSPSASAAPGTPASFTGQGFNYPGALTPTLGSMGMGLNGMGVVGMPGVGLPGVGVGGLGVGGMGMGVGALGGMGGMGVGGDAQAGAMLAAAAAASQGLNRTVYLGNIHPETTTEDLCNAIRGGMLQSVRYMQDKHIAFVTFIDPAAAFTFYQVSTFQGLTLNNRRLKIGWGKNSGPLAPAIALAVHGGATRNVYVGNIEDFDVFNEEKLKRDFGEYGDIELVNFLKEKNCAFVNFTNISNAIKAIDQIKTKPDYTNLRIAHGKDRCANPPRSGAQGGSGARKTSGTGGHNGSAHAGAGANGSAVEGDGKAASEEPFSPGDGSFAPNGYGHHEEGLGLEQEEVDESGLLDADGALAQE